MSEWVMRNGNATMLAIFTATAAMGQKNCSLKPEEQLCHRIGKYRMTSDLDLISFETELTQNYLPFGDANNNPNVNFNNKILQTVSCAIHTDLTPSKDALLVQIGGIPLPCSEREICPHPMENSMFVVASNLATKNTSELAEDTTHDSLEGPIDEIISNGCFKLIEETEVLQTDKIKESVEITISEVGEIIRSDIISWSKTHKEGQVGHSSIIDRIMESDILIENGTKENANHSHSIFTTKKNECKHADLKVKATFEINSSERMSEMANNGDESQTKFSSVISNFDNSSENKTMETTIGTSCNQRHHGFEIFGRIATENSEAFGALGKLRQWQNEKTEYPTAESKIALEIREMRQREEELRQMRKHILVDSVSSDQEKVNGLSECSVKSDESQDIDLLNTIEHGLQINQGSVINQPNVFSTLNLKSLNVVQDYNVGCVFASRKKENIKVKSFVFDKEKAPDNKVHEDSSIEREIRIEKERDKDLRIEKATRHPERAGFNLQNKCDTDSTTTQHYPIISSYVAMEKSIGSTKLFSDTQKQLATSRIQQEIEEQIQREKTLNALGNTQMISPERLNTEMLKMSVVPASNNNDTIVSLPGATTIAQDPSSLKTDIGLRQLIGQHTVKQPSSTNSSNSSLSKHLGSTVRRFSNPPRCKSVSMQRFIASKGKEIVFGNGHSTKAGCFDYTDMKPPQVRKGDVAAQKRSATAEMKIQEELKEMKAREEELTKQRLLRLSQPKLSVESVFCPMERCCLLDAEQEDPFPRRRSLLIEQWEQRIQKTDITS